MSDEQEEPKKEVEIATVNKYQASWDPAAIFTGYNYRAVLHDEPSVLKGIERFRKLRKKLKKELGKEGDEWLARTNTKTDEDEIYFKKSNWLVSWKMADYEKFNDLIARVERHSERVDNGD